MSLGLWPKSPENLVSELIQCHDDLERIVCPIHVMQIQWRELYQHVQKLKVSFGKQDMDLGCLNGWV